MPETNSNILQDDSFSWNLSDMYTSEESWEQEFTSSLESSTKPFWPSFQTLKNNILSTKSATSIKEAFESILKIRQKIEKLYTYAHLVHDEDLAHSNNNNRYKRAYSLYIDFEEATSWLQPTLLSLSDDEIKQIINSSEIKEFQFLIEQITRNKPHTLSSELEEILAMSEKPLSSIKNCFSALNDVDLKFDSVQDSEGNSHELSHNTYLTLVRSNDRTLRKNTFTTLHKTFGSFKNIFAEILQGTVQRHIFSMKARKHSSSLSSALFGNNIPESVYLNLISTVKEFGIPIFKQFISLKKQILNISDFALYDVCAPTSTTPTKNFSIEESIQLVIDSVKPLGENYKSILEKGLKEDLWVDFHPKNNKRSGAYSSGCKDSHPYILMNFEGKYNDLTTLAHEAGHSMHSYFSRSTQPFCYSDYSIFVAEVASTFNEILLFEHLWNNPSSSKEEKLYLILKQLENIYGTLFRQTMFAEFELTIHKYVESGNNLTADYLSSEYLKLLKTYFGEEVIIDDFSAYEWARIPHFHYNFYVFQYATGISAAYSLSKKVIDGDKECLNNYLNFLSSGSKNYPIDVLKQAGVDMSSSQAIKETLKIFELFISKTQVLINSTPENM